MFSRATHILTMIIENKQSAEKVRISNERYLLATRAANEAIWDWDAEAYPGVFLDKKDVKRVDRFSQFALVAGYSAVIDSGLDFTKENVFRCGVILGSGIGGLHEIEDQVARLIEKGPDRVSPFTVPKMMLNAAGGNLSIRYGNWVGFANLSA